jgi:hypothetical protein
MKIQYMLLLLVLVLVSSSCSESWLEPEPQTSIETEKAIQSVTDAQYALNGIYNTMQSYEYYGARMTYYGDVTGEDAQAVSNTKRSADYYMFQYNKDNAPSSLWRLPYRVIRLCNNVLAADDKYLTSDLKGQALAIRALALFDVNRVYGYPYQKDNGASLGGVIVLKAPSYKEKPRRSTVEQCYGQIIGDLTDAIALLDNKANPGRVTKYAAEALLARAYLYKGDYQNAFTLAEQAITDAQTAKHRLWTNAEYALGWSSGLDTEVLFKIVNTSTDNAGNESVANLYHEKGYKDIKPSDDFRDLMKLDAKDVRNILLGKIYYLKYQGNSTDEDWRGADIPVVRLSEVYLIAAEAAVNLPDRNDKALFYLNAIVTRANPEKVIAGTVTVNQVLTERRKELMGEGHRFFDAMRLGLTIERKGKSHLTALIPESRSYNWNYFKIVLPVPKSELEANENMRDQQNPGY